uniref:Ubiquitin-like domain-containing protein n=1 Tax=Arion vulgaris TaxID=1028688 RepID=A0A0B7APJ5_9EUPU
MDPGNQNIQFEAAPDVQVYIRLIRKEILIDELEANINISKTTNELKQSLSGPLNIAVEYMELWKDNIQLQDDISLMQYDICYNDVLDIKDTTPGDRPV